MTLPAFEPFFVADGDTFVPNDIAHGGWGPTLGGQVVGGLLARAVEQQRADPELIPARFTVDILRRVATAPVQVHADVVRTGRRMQALDARLMQGGELVARASTLLLKRSGQPRETPWTTTISMPPIPQEPAQFDGSVPMFITPYGGDASDYTFPWQHNGPRYAWVREIRPLVDDEPLTPFVRAAMAVDVTASLTGFSKAGLEFINADYTLTLCRLPTGSIHRVGWAHALQRRRNCRGFGKPVRCARTHRLQPHHGRGELELPTIRRCAASLSARFTARR